MISKLYLGSIYEKLGNSNKALKEYLDCNKLAQEYNREDCQILAITNMAYLAEKNSDSKKIIEDALNSFSKSNNQILLDFFRYKLAIINAESGETDKAKQEIEKMLNNPIYQSKTNPNYSSKNESVARFIFNKGLGEINIKENNYNKALDHYYKALEFQVDYQVNKAEIYIFIADAYLKQKKYHSSDSILQIVKSMIGEDLLIKRQFNETYLKLFNEIGETEKGLETLITLRNIDNILNIENNKIQGYITDKLENENLKAENYLHKARVKYISGIAILLLMLSSLYYLYKQARNKKNLLQMEVSKKELEVENKELEIQKQDLEFKNKDLKLEAVNKVIDVKEEKEKEFAQILHDNVGANLSALNMFLSTLKKDIPEKKYNHLSNVLTQTIKNSRHLSHLLVPPALKGGGLICAITEKAEEYTCEKLTIEVSSTQEFVALEDKIARSLYNAILEFMNNTMRHSEATNMQIDFSVHSNTLVVKVMDNGKGFDISNIPQSKGLGLNSIKSRIEYFDGTIDIQSSNKGTIINLTVPAKEALKQSA